jgi:HAD superfamily hydrolase (TIGR01509 family)
VTLGVLVDLYGTLVEPDWVKLQAGRDAIADRLGVSRAAANAAWASTHEARMRGEYGSLEGDLAAIRAAAGGGPAAAGGRDDRLLSELAAAERANWSSGVRPYEDAIPMLRRLRGTGVRVAIVTNASVEATGVIPALGLEALVDVVVASCEVGVLKPELLAAALRDLRVSAADAVVVDDDSEVVVAARAMGMPAILVDRGAGFSTTANAGGSALGGDPAVVTGLTGLVDLLVSPEIAPLR